MRVFGHISPRWRNSLIGAGAAVAAGLAFLIPPFGAGLAGRSYDWLFLFRNHIPVEGVTILFMDPESDARLGQQRLASYDRSLHARLIDCLRQYQPRAIVFDLIFPQSTNATADTELARATREAGNVVVAAKHAVEVYEGEILGQTLTPPYPALGEVARWGVTEVALQPDRVFRSHYHLQALDVPSMAWRVAELTMTNPPPPYEARWINYYGPPGFFPHFSYWQAFETNVIPAAAISNKVVFVGGLADIGYAGGKRFDEHPTPYTARTGRRSAGVEINATVYLNLVRGDWLRRPSPWIEASFLLVCGALFGGGLATRRPLSAVALGATGVMIVAAGAMFIAWQWRIWFPWLIVGAVQIPTALGWSVLVQSARLYREKRALEQALALASGGDAASHVAASPAPQLAEQTQPKLGTPSPFITPTPGMETGLLAPDGQPFPSVADHELLRIIGKGAYGQVYLARDAIGTFHAVKIVQQQAVHDPTSLEREFNGIRNFAPISRSHPGFVNILHVGRSDGGRYIYCVMELADDETTGQQINPDTYSAKNLARVLKRRGRLPLAECLRLCLQLGDALEHLHRHNLIHRDIKPSNIIFVGGAPKFADIGLVTGVAADGREASVVGTPYRMAPEGPGKPTADIYSLGKVLYEAGLGLEVDRFPELPTEFIKSGADSALFEFNRIVMKACDEEKRRYPSAAALCADMAALLNRLKNGTT